ncbi:kell blood group glycoprotein isoform X1 [Electrophorus electricus]|uniref:kell blood group glycoprotein isoform X1 n=1 Tax=Electrophorus electricus TaxID=8005 RepID=UPI0015D0C212|nr:kell blood group glycoprotein isoform X1 [Electrophorus electricus]
MDQNSSVLQGTLEVSQEQPQSEESKSLVRNQCVNILLALLGFFHIGSIAWLLLYSQMSLTNQDSPTCLSPACKGVAGRFSAALDPFSRPCDYFKFTCASKASITSRGRQRGKFIFHNRTREQEHRRRSINKEEMLRLARDSDSEEKQNEPFERLPDRQTALLQAIKEILESPVVGVSVNSVEHKARRFYKTCMDPIAAESVSSERFITLIEQLGGWSVSRNWTEPDFNATLVLLMEQYDTFPFFNVYVGPDHRANQPNSSQHYIQIDQPEFQFTVDWNNKKHKYQSNPQSWRSFYLFCKKLLELFDVPSFDITLLCGQYLSLCSTLVIATSPLEYRLSQKLLYHRVTIQELQMLAPAIDWLRCLKATLHPVPVSQSDFVLLHNLPYLTHMSKIVSEWKLKPDTMKSGPLHMYMVLTLLHSLIHTLDSKFTQTLKNISNAIGVEDVPRWRDCVLQTIKGFDNWLSHAIKENYALKEAEELMHDIYSSFESKVANMSWRDEETRDIILNKVKSLTPKLSSSTKLIDQLKFWKQHYAEVVVSEKDYFANYLQLLALHQKRRSSIFFHTEQPDWLSVSPFLSGNDIIIPVGMFVLPVFHPSYPRAINYGMLGSLIAKDLFHLLLPEILAQSESPSLESACVWSHYLSRSKAPRRLANFSLPSPQQKEVWMQYSALQVALQSYTKSLQRHSIDTSVSGLSHIHLFLSSFIQASCDSEPYRVSMPFEPSFLVSVLCETSDICPKPLICLDRSQGRLPDWC